MCQLLQGLDYLQHFNSSVSHSQLEVVTGSKNWSTSSDQPLCINHFRVLPFQAKNNTINSKNLQSELQPCLPHVIPLITLDQREEKAKVK